GYVRVVEDEGLDRATEPLRREGGQVLRVPTQRERASPHAVGGELVLHVVPLEGAVVAPSLPGVVTPDAGGCVRNRVLTPRPVPGEGQGADPCRLPDEVARQHAPLLEPPDTGCLEASTSTLGELDHHHRRATSRSSFPETYLCRQSSQ